MCHDLVERAADGLLSGFPAAVTRGKKMSPKNESRPIAETTSRRRTGQDKLETVEESHKADKTVVLAHGVFDLVHKGHVLPRQRDRTRNQ